MTITIQIDRNESFAILVVSHESIRESMRLSVRPFVTLSLDGERIMLSIRTCFMVVTCQPIIPY